MTMCIFVCVSICSYFSVNCTILSQYKLVCMIQDVVRIDCYGWNDLNVSFKTLFA